MKIVLILVGAVTLALGLLFVGQGTGYVRWPSSSFMVSDMSWAYYGGGIALAGLALIMFARR